MKDYTSPQVAEPIQNESETPKRHGDVVNCRNVNVRKAPTTNAKVLTFLPIGTEVAILKNVGDEWFAVSTKDIPKGYIMKEFIKEKE